MSVIKAFAPITSDATTTCSTRSNIINGLDVAIAPRDTARWVGHTTVTARIVYFSAYCWNASPTSDVRSLYIKVISLNDTDVRYTWIAGRLLITDMTDQPIQRALPRVWRRYIKLLIHV